MSLIGIAGIEGDNARFASSFPSSSSSSLAFPPPSLSSPTSFTFLQNQITLLSPERTVILEEKMSTPVGVFHWKHFKAENVRFVQVKSTLVKRKLWNPICKPNRKRLLEVEEIEVYGTQSSLSVMESPRKMTLITSGFLPHSEVRRGELLETLERNLRNPYIETVHILFQDCPWLPAQNIFGEDASGEGDTGGVGNEIESQKRLRREARGKAREEEVGTLGYIKEAEKTEENEALRPVMAKPAIYDHPKVIVTCMHTQPTYKAFFTLANREYAGKIVILSNGDMSFTDSLRHLPLDFEPPSLSSSPSPLQRRLPKAMILSRWSANCENLVVFEHEHRCWSDYLSYDSFVFQPPISEELVNQMDYVMNRKKAEHHTAKILQEELDLYNPCLDLVSLHEHCSDVREWKTGDDQFDIIEAAINTIPRLFPARVLNVALDHLTLI